jgi:hypothetical protein
LTFTTAVEDWQLHTTVVTHQISPLKVKGKPGVAAITFGYPLTFLAKEYGRKSTSVDKDQDLVPSSEFFTDLYYQFG